MFEWHRCEVLSINKSLDSIHIYYIDLGTKDLIPFRFLKHLRVNSLLFLFSLDFLHISKVLFISQKDNYKTISKFAIHCRLSQIKPIDSSIEWSTTAISTFSKLVLNKTCTLTVKRKQDQTYEIDVCVKTTNVGEQMIRERCAIPDDNAELALIQERLNKLIPVEVAHFSKRYFKLFCCYVLN